MRRILTLLAACLATAAASIAPAATIDVTAAPYNATPDGGADDAAAINSAIAAAQPGDTVFIPAGTFNISARINAKSGVNLLGASSATTTLRYAGSSSIQLLGLTGVSNVELSHFTLDGNNSNKPTQGVYATGSSSLSLHDLAFKNLGIKTGFGPHAIFFDTNVTNSIIQNNAISNIGASSNWGAGIRLGHGSSFNQVLNNTISTTGRGGILCDNGSTDLVIRNNTVTGSGGTGLGIELQNGCDRAVIEDNHIDHWLSIDNSHYLAVRRNVVSDFSGVYKYTGLELVDAHDNVFTDNIIDGGQKIGISISGPNAKQRILWARNTIKTASTWGIQIQGETQKASQMYFYKNSFQHTIRTGPNTLYAPQGHGVRFNGNADHIVFDSNLIDSNLGQGVQMSGGNLDSLTFMGNTITNNALAAVTSSGVTNLTWTDNYVAGNGSDAEPPPFSPISAGDEGPIEIDRLVNVGEPVAFSIDSLRNGGQLAAVTSEPLTNMLWDFGDGLPSTDFSPTHTFGANGIYLISVLGWDAAGNAMFDQATVAVVPEPNYFGAALLAAAVTLPYVRARGTTRLVSTGP